MRTTKKKEKISKICTCKHHTSTESKMRRKQTVSHWYQVHIKTRADISSTLYRRNQEETETGWKRSKTPTNHSREQTKTGNHMNLNAAVHHCQKNKSQVLFISFFFFFFQSYTSDQTRAFFLCVQLSSNHNQRHT